MSGEVWEQIYARLAALIEQHRTTLIFVNTRRLAERITRHLSDRLGEDHVTAHHGSMAKEQRLDAEQRLKSGKLKALVATASLELGIDIGDIDLVCQIGSPHTIASFLQRVGRSGHMVGGMPKGRLFPSVAGRSRRMRGAARQRVARRARPPDCSGAAARRPGAADRSRGRAQEWKVADLLAVMRRAYRIAI
jgi:ATP-dependent Lhr-like helicase